MTSPKSDKPKKSAKEAAPVPERALTDAGHLEKTTPSFPIVGIGVSAGGLEAFRHFFQGMPADSGMAFVLDQYIDPNHEIGVAGTQPRFGAAAEVRVTPTVENCGAASAQALLIVADQALYDAKHAGRNCIVPFQPTSQAS